VHHKQRGGSTTLTEDGAMQHPHKKPSSGHKGQENNAGSKENNEGCVTVRSHSWIAVAVSLIPISLCHYLLIKGDEWK
jgi:hypothetical protein